MKYTDFMKLVENRKKVCSEVLAERGKVYARGAETDPGIDRLGSFKRQAEIDGCSPEEALRGQMSKHYTALMDFIKDPLAISPDQWAEKLTDVHNFLYLLEGLVSDRFYECGDE